MEQSLNPLSLFDLIILVAFLLDVSLSKNVFIISYLVNNVIAFSTSEVELIITKSSYYFSANNSG